MKFGEQLRTLRNSQKMTQKELADMLGISPSTIGMYEQNRRIPDIKTLTQIASIFEVSLDTLLTNNIEQNKSIGNFIRHLRVRHNLSQKDFGKLFDTSKSEISAYENNIRTPDNHILQLICDYFGIDIDKLNERFTLQTANQPQASALSERERDLLFTFRQLNKDNQDIIVGFAKKYLKEQKYEEM